MRSSIRGSRGFMTASVWNKIRGLTISSLLILPLVPATAWGFAPPSIQSNNDGVKQYQKEDYAGAFNQFAGALARDAFNPYYHFNLADTFYKNGDYPKALAEYDSVDENPKATPDLKFKAMFNAGNAAVEAKDIGKALQYYQRALQYNPESLEVKTNIELALKQQQNNGGGGQKDQKNQNNQNQNKNDKQQQNQKNNQDQKQNQNQQNQNQNNQPQPTPRPTARPFKSQALNESDVRRILEELKRQEEQIRARQYQERRDTPERQIDKDW